MSQTDISSLAHQPHPKGLAVCFGTELWERFCFYGMRALLTLFFVDAACSFRMPQDEASKVYGAYLALIYATNLFGGMLADKLLGFRRAVIIGGLLMSVGEFMLLGNSQLLFFSGLSLLIVGCGLLKPNVSAILGRLYEKDDPRRDGGFTIFYMGINIGAFLGPIITGWFGNPVYGFAAAGVGMVIAVAYFAANMHKYGEHGLPPAGVAQGRAVAVTALYVAIVIPSAYFLLHHEAWVGDLLNVIGGLMAAYFLWIGVQGGRTQLGRMVALLFLLVANAVFWACFEQAGNSLNLFTKTNVDRMVFGWEMPTAWGQSLNAIFIVALGIPFAKLWVWLAAKGMNPSAPFKFSLGLIQVGLGFWVLSLGQGFATEGIVPLVFLVLCYLIHTTGELCLSPVGLSTMTKLAPEGKGGLVMGGWFLSTAYGSYVAGVISAIAGRSGNVSTDTLDPVAAMPVYGEVFDLLAKIGIYIGLGAFVLSFGVSRLMRGIK